MAHFFPAPGAPRADYEIDGRLAPDSVSRLRITEGDEKKIGLWGGQDLWLKPTIPNILGTPIFSRDLQKDVQVLTLEGKKAGTTVLQTGLGTSIWVSLTVEVIAKSGNGLPDDRALSAPYQPFVLETAAKDFSSGFGDGLAQKIDTQLAADIMRKIHADEVGFYKGYAYGLLLGLWEGLKSLLVAIKAIVDIAMMTTPQGLVNEVLLNLTSESHRRMRQRQIDDVASGLKRLQEMAQAASDAMIEVAAKPHLYTPHSRTAGLVIGAELGDVVASKARSMSAEEIGRFVGEVLGLVLFEILSQILFAVFTGGTGNAAKGGLTVIEGGSEAARLATRLTSRLERILEGLPTLRKIIVGTRGEQAAARAAAAALEAELELAFGEAAVLQRGARGGFPLLERLPELSAEARAAAAKLLGQELGPELKAAWNACHNDQAGREIAEVQRLLKTGAAADREAAYQLSERTYGNWRDRFWTRVRGNEGLRKIFTDAGASFEGKSGAPYFKLDGAKTKNLQVTLDHFIERRVDNPGRAVDALNVRPSISFENSATLEAIRKDNFLKGWKSPIDP